MLGWRDEDGYWRPPVSKCCGARLVYYSRLFGHYQRWWGYPHDPIPDALRCAQCNQEVQQSNEQSEEAGGVE
jgi:hypothetical protein